MGSNLFHYNFSFFVQSFCSHIHLFSQINFEITLFVVFVFPEMFEASMNFTLCLVSLFIFYLLYSGRMLVRVMFYP